MLCYSQEDPKSRLGRGQFGGKPPQDGDQAGRVEMDGEVLGEAVGMANLEMAMELGEGEVLVARPILLLLKVMGIQTSATTLLKTS